MNTERAPRSGGILNVAIQDKNALYSAYMPFIRNGGLFVATQKPYQLGDEVFIVLALMDEAEKLPIAGRVAWISPRGAQNNRNQGIGIQFRDNGVVRTKIETYLAGMLQSARATDTL
jgi:type IV pilus assembly protein PilZ